MSERETKPFCYILSNYTCHYVYTHCNQFTPSKIYFTQCVSYIYIINKCRCHLG